VARHPELTLTRRQIARFILAQATTRSKDVQTLLRLEAIDEVRARLKTALNTADRRTKDADAASSAAKDSLRRALDIETLKSDDVLAAVNKQREVLGSTRFRSLIVGRPLRPGSPAEKMRLKDQARTPPHAIWKRFESTWIAPCSTMTLLPN